MKGTQKTNTWVTDLIGQFWMDIRAISSEDAKAKASEASLTLSLMFARRLLSSQIVRRLSDNA